jgi:glycosyltransferase involved in cell wall biosynthesis
MKVAIVVNFGFPKGMASASRTRHLAMGITENGSKVEILIPKPTEYPNNVLNVHLLGTIDGSVYRYTSTSTIIPGNYIKCRYMVLKGFIACAGYIHKNRKTLDAVILYLRSINGVAFLSFWCKLSGIPIILELCEWSISHRNTDLKTRIQNWFLTTPLFFFADGVIAISTFIKQRVSDFSDRVKRDIPCLITPILVKSDNYQCNVPYLPNGDLLFCGILDQTDIVLFLLNVMVELKENGLTRKLGITGKAFNPSNLERIKSEIQKRDLSELVILRGYLPEEGLIKSYCSASVLLAPLPSGDRSIARFPNKIGEYLASGRPIVTTSIGDIPKYLTNEESAYLVDPDDVKGFATAVRDVLNNPVKAEKIGKRGYEVAMKYFDPKANGKLIMEFIETIKAKA